MVWPSGEEGLVQNPLKPKRLGSKPPRIIDRKTDCHQSTPELQNFNKLLVVVVIRYRVAVVSAVANYPGRHGGINSI